MLYTIVLDKILYFGQSQEVNIFTRSSWCEIFAPQIHENYLIVGLTQVNFTFSNYVNRD